MAFDKIKDLGDIQRKMLTVAIDVSEGATPEYIVVGYKVESAALEFNPDVETITDILGDTYSSVNKMELSMTFDPHRLTSGEKGKLGEKLLSYFRNRDYAKFSEFKCVLIYGFLESKEGYQADLYDSCTVVPNSLGGDTWLDFPFDVNFGGNIVKGKADGLKGDIVFTADSDAEALSVESKAKTDTKTK